MAEPTNGVDDRLEAWGWRSHFQAQLDLDDMSECRPARVVACHRGAFDLMMPNSVGPGKLWQCHNPWAGEADEEQSPTTGDWLMVGAEDQRPRRLLDRFSLITRRAAGKAGGRQAIGANIDTLLITASCNEDFNPARLERYLALALGAGVQPVILLTKADLADDPDTFAARTRALRADIVVETLDARDPTSLGVLKPWTGMGQTLALVGSSGVGKSTLLNTLLGRLEQATQGIREDDAKGRHTTTARSLHRVPGGSLVIDTPGMRELGLLDASDGIAELFEDIEALAGQCKFRDCGHAGEPGCAIRAAIEDGRIEEARLKRWEKLRREDRMNSESEHERRQRMRSFGKMVRSAMDKRAMDKRHAERNLD